MDFEDYSHSNQRSQGYSGCNNDHYNSVVSVGGRLYMTGRVVKNTENFPDAEADGCAYCMLYPITSTDAINWEVFTNSVKCTSPFINYHHEANQSQILVGINYLKSTIDF